MIVGFYTSVDTQKNPLLLLGEFARSEEIALHRDQKGGSIRSTEGRFCVVVSTSPNHEDFAITILNSSPSIFFHRHGHRQYGNRSEKSLSAVTWRATCLTSNIFWSGWEQRSIGNPNIGDFPGSDLWTSHMTLSRQRFFLKLWRSHGDLKAHPEIINTKICRKPHSEVINYCNSHGLFQAWIFPETKQLDLTLAKFPWDVTVNLLWNIITHPQHDFFFEFRPTFSRRNLKCSQRRKSLTSRRQICHTNIWTKR